MIGVDARYNTLTVSNGGVVCCASAVVGDSDNAGHNRIDVAGGSAALRVSQNLTIGADGFGNVVHVGTGGVLRCGSMTVGRDDAGPDNALEINGGSVTVTGAVLVTTGALTLAAGSLQADAIVVAPGGALALAPGFDLRAGTLTLAGDFSYPGTNASPDLLRPALVFPTGAVHRLQLNALDRGASLAGFPNNRALGTLDVEGPVTVTNVCYIWALSGSGTLTVSPGARVYCMGTEGWRGTIVLQGKGAFVQVPIALGGTARQTNAAVRLFWTSASGLVFDVEWADNVVTGRFGLATNVFSTNPQETWTDEGSGNRSHPTQTLQRFYRLKAHP